MPSARTVSTPYAAAVNRATVNPTVDSPDSEPLQLGRDQAEHLLLQHLDLLDRLTPFAARRNGFPEADREDLDSWIKLRLIGNDYSILRKFRGTSRFSTYLTTVVMNLARDYRIQRWGRWRPSVKAQRLGKTAVLLERLLERERHCLEQAIEMLRINHGVKIPAAQLRDLALELPQRQQRPRLESTPMHLFPAEETASEPRLSRQQLARFKERLEVVLHGLPDQDRLLLKLHYCDGIAITVLATSFRLPQRSLYSRRNRLLRQLRRELEGQGLGWTNIKELLDWSALDFGKLFSSHLMTTQQA